MTLQYSREEEEFPIEELDKSGKWSESFQGETRAGQGDKERTGLPGIIKWGGFVRASLVAQMVKSLPAVWETQVRSLGQEDPLEKEMATHSSILAWKIPWIEKPGRLQSMRSQRVRSNWETSHTFRWGARVLKRRGNRKYEKQRERWRDRQSNNDITRGLRNNVGFPSGSVGKESTCSTEDIVDDGSIPGLGRSPGEGDGYPHQYFLPERLVWVKASAFLTWITTSTSWFPCHSLFWGFPGGASGKEPTRNTEDIRDSGSIPGSGRSRGGGNGNPLQYSCLGNPKDRGDQHATVQEAGQNLVTKQQQQGILNVWGTPFPPTLLLVCFFLLERTL